MIRRLAPILIGVLFAGCATGVPPGSVAPTTGASPIPSVAGDPIELRRAPDDLACDALGVSYKRVTFRVDAAAGEQVTAVTDAGTVLQTYWSKTFVAGDAGDPVVRDGAGQSVVSDGDVLALPVSGWPRLRGYFVCPGANALYVLDQDPA